MFCFLFKPSRSFLLGGLLPSEKSDLPLLTKAPWAPRWTPSTASAARFNHESVRNSCCRNPVPSVGFLSADWHVNETQSPSSERKASIIKMSCFKSSCVSMHTRQRYQDVDNGCVTHELVKKLLMVFLSTTRPSQWFDPHSFVLDAAIFFCKHVLWSLFSEATVTSTWRFDYATYHNKLSKLDEGARRSDRHENLAAEAHVCVHACVWVCACVGEWVGVCKCHKLA